MKNKFETEQMVWVMHYNKPQLLEILAFTVRKDHITCYCLYDGKCEIELDEDEIFETKAELIASL